MISDKNLIVCELFVPFLFSVDILVMASTKESEASVATASVIYATLTV